MAKLSKTADVLLGYLTDALRQHDVCNGAKVTRVFEISVLPARVMRTRIFFPAVEELESRPYQRHQRPNRISGFSLGHGRRMHLLRRSNRNGP
jgi:hypothetical protein